MTDRGIRRGLIVVVMLISAALYAFLADSRLDASDLNFLVESGACSYVDPVSVHTFLDAMVKDTSFENRYRVNQRHAPDQLNIYIIHSSDSRYGIPRTRKFNRLRRNAVAIGDLRAIVIDSALLDELADLRGVQHQDWGVVGYLLGWIIGHEIGHIELGHGVSHYTPHGSLTALIASPDDIDVRELEADQVFVSRMVQESPSIAAEVASLMIEIVERLGQGYSDSARKPHYYFRAVTALKYIEESTDDSELKALIVRVLNAHASP